jgi:hypothetical protein
MNKYEQLVEFIINDETDKARELFHNIVVEKSRDIYESLIDENDLNEVGGNEVEDLVDEVSHDEEGLSEEEDMMDIDDEDSDSMDFDDSGDLDDHEEEHGDVEDRVQDLESALDELKAEFDALMAGEEQEEEQFPGIHGDDNMDDDNMGEQQFMEAESDEEDEEDEVDESIVREYVERVGETNQKAEGGEVGVGKRASVNAKSTVACKNDMGGTAANIVTGKGATANQDGNRPAASEKPKGTLVNNPLNKPGARAGNAFAKKETGKTGEGQTTGKAVGGVNTKSPLAR